jgi:hypothetical protein
MNPIARVMKLLTDRMPRKVAIASVFISVTLVVFAFLFVSLGSAHDEAIAKNSTLKKTLDQTTRNAKQSREDREFILGNQEKYEELLHGDRLIPHTRRVATDQLAALARARGLTTLTYDIAAAGVRAAATAASQPAKGGYRVKVEQMSLKVGAPLDTDVFDFLMDLGENFPGSAVVEQFSLERAAGLTTDALNQVSRGRESGLVKSEIHVTWRTAEAEDDDKKPANPPARGGR